MNSLALKSAAQRWWQEGLPAVIVTVERARGSVPREAGTRMVVGLGDTLGTIGGGHLEWQAVETARRSLSGAALPEPRHLALGPALGQCCGGAVTLRFEWLGEAALQRWTPAPPNRHLNLHGAGHVGLAIIRLLADLDVAVDWIDTREDAFPPEEVFAWSLAPGIRAVVTESPAHEARVSAPGCDHLVMTHSHALDLDIVLALLRRTDTGSVGLIGSGTKRARFERRLLAQGVDPARVQALVCPIGLPGITGKDPATVAISVVAQWLQGGRDAARTHRAGAPAGESAPIG